MRIGILTFHRAYNCGAMLQAWALKTVLERMGHTVEFPICNHVGETTRWANGWVNNKHHGLKWVRSLLGHGILNLLSFPVEDIRRHRYKSFRTKNLPERAISPAELGDCYDVIVVGSDQVWNIGLLGEDAPVFFGGNISECVRMIAYAASCGDKPLDNCTVGRIANSLYRFSAVSVRETTAKKQLSQLTSKQIDLTLDPTLLLSATDYSAIEQKICISNQPYLFMYTLFAEPFFITTARQLAKRLGVKCVIAPCYQYSRYAAPRGLTYGISPDRLLGWIHGAKYVLSGSFHGTALGILYQKHCLSLRLQEDDYESRPAALLNMIGCGDRLVTPATSLDKMAELLEKDIPQNCYEKIAEKRNNSITWIKKALQQI